MSEMGFNKEDAALRAATDGRMEMRAPGWLATMDTPLGVSQSLKAEMVRSGFKTISDIRKASDRELLSVVGLGPWSLLRIRRLIGQQNFPQYRSLNAIEKHLRGQGLW